MFTHRATVIAGETREGDRQVLRDGLPVGRVHPQQAGIRAIFWLDHIVDNFQK